MYERLSLIIARAMTFSLEDLKREEGQTAVEYGLVLAFVSLGLIVALTALKDSIATFLGNIGTRLAGIVP